MDYSICIVAVSLLLAGSQAKAPTSKIWTPLAEKDMHLVVKGSIPKGVKQVSYFRCDLEALRKEIDRAPRNDDRDYQGQRRAVYLPMPDGSLKMFLINRTVSFVETDITKRTKFTPFEGVDPLDARTKIKGFTNMESIIYSGRWGKVGFQLGRATKYPTQIFYCFRTEPEAGS